MSKLQSYSFNQVSHWRERAACARRSAQRLCDPHSPLGMVTIAEQYERLADACEWAAKYGDDQGDTTTEPRLKLSR